MKKERWERGREKRDAFEKTRYLREVGKRRGGKRKMREKRR